MDIKSIIENNHIESEYTFKYNDNLIFTICGKNEKPWFRLSDITNITKHLNTSKCALNINSSNKKKLSSLMKYTDSVPKNSQPHSIFVNVEGLKQIMCMCRMPCTEEFINFLGIRFFYKYKDKEIEIVDEISDFLDELNIKHKTQFPVDKYRIDLYIPRYKLAVEIDENGHIYVDKDYEQTRQKKIKKILGCKILRFNPDNKKFKISQLLAKITAHIFTFE